jgi:hypothetical protein
MLNTQTEVLGKYSFEMIVWILNMVFKSKNRIQTEGISETWCRGRFLG